MKKIIIFSAFVAISAIVRCQTSRVELVMRNQQKISGTLIALTDSSITIEPGGSISGTYTISAADLGRGTIYTDSCKIGLFVWGNTILTKTEKLNNTEAQGTIPQKARKEDITNDAYSLSTARPRQYSSSQKQKYDFVVRKGNKYYVGISEYSKKEFLDFLKTNNPTAYNHYNTGYRTANIGWGLFGGGLAGTLIGTIIMATARTSSANNAGIFFASVGSSCLISSTICLGVGYGRMHNSADIYNIQTEHKRLMQLSMNTSGSNLGLALTW